MVILKDFLNSIQLSGGIVLIFFMNSLCRFKKGVDPVQLASNEAS